MKFSFPFVLARPECRNSDLLVYFGQPQNSRWFPRTDPGRFFVRTGGISFLSLPGLGVALQLHLEQEKKHEHLISMDGQYTFSIFFLLQVKMSVRNMSANKKWVTGDRLTSEISTFLSQAWKVCCSLLW